MIRERAQNNCKEGFKVIFSGVFREMTGGLRGQEHMENFYFHLPVGTLQKWLKNVGIEM